MTWFEKIHQNAVRSARTFRRSEYDLVVAIQAVDAKKVYRKMGHRSAFEYCVKALKLTEGNAYAFLNVARKSVHMPKIKKALSEGRVSVSEVKRAVSVMTPQNQDIWLDKVERLTQRQLEKEVAKENPKLSVQEKIRPVSEKHSELRCGIDANLEKKLNRVREVLSQKQRRPASIEDALKAMVDLYLEKQDPVEKAKRIQKKKTKTVIQTQKPNSSLVPAAIRHQVMLRDQGRCAWTDDKGQICGRGDFVDIHHKIPRAQGGPHTPENLILLCKGHHQMVHSIERTGLRSEGRHESWLDGSPPRFPPRFS